ncbi:hypothetical protein ACEWY4_017956 [Coilia grayii]|uniref:EGF-like domain-containing protein n=1 Tax=Coilia grayii TaxID=363190 RepID=A0ABD1JIB5_9TELE
MCVAVMGSLQWPALMLLASLILLSWTTSFAGLDPSGNYIPGAKELPFEVRGQTQQALDSVEKTVSAMKYVIDVTTKHKDTVATLFKGLSKFAEAAPVIGWGFSVINTFLAFVPQHDPVMQELKNSFAVVNSKLDSISVQISDLVTDVEWFNYASVYSQDEVCILNAWKKYTDFFGNAQSNDINFLAKAFVNYYEYTQVEASVDNLYHYLTVHRTYLTKNLNELLVTKLECDVMKILKHNWHFSSVLLKGMSLNIFYWELIGFNTTSKEAEHNHMFKTVFEAQSKVINKCLKEHMYYVKKDVERTAKPISSDLQRIAQRVKEALDNKYSWYKWVVIVYKRSREEEEDVIPHNTMTKIPVSDDIIVAVTHTQHGVMEANAKDAVNWCNHKYLSCLTENQTSVYNINDMKFELNLVDHVKVTHYTYGKQDFGEAPKPYRALTCKVITKNKNTYLYTIAVHASKMSHRCDLECGNNGTCEKLLDSNQAWCKCKDNYFGDRCEKKTNTKLKERITLHLPTLNKCL